MIHIILFKAVQVFAIYLHSMVKKIILVLNLEEKICIARAIIYYLERSSISFIYDSYLLLRYKKYLKFSTMFMVPISVYFILCFIVRVRYWA